MNGNFYVPGVGDTVIDDTTANTGEVAFVRTVGFNEIELFIKNKPGAFRLEAQDNEAGNIIPSAPNRLMGAILKTEFENQFRTNVYIWRCKF